MEERRNTLTDSDGRLFYRLLDGLTDYVLEQKGKIPVPEGSRGLPEKKIVSDYVWAHSELIDEYVRDTPSLTEEDRQILLSWKRALPGFFVLERHQRSGSVFILVDPEKGTPGDECVYMVRGIQSTFREMLDEQQLRTPVCLRAVLLPWKDTITVDGLILPVPSEIGTTLRQQLREVYKSARDNGKIHCTL